MGGFLGIGGASWKTDRSAELTGMGNLNNVFNFAMPNAKSSVSAGASDLSSAGDYWKKILSGNRSAMMGAVAPEANATRAGADASKRQLATSGTARGGGTNAVNQQRDTDTMAKIDNLLFGARPEAAKETAKIGGVESSIGTNLLNTAGTSATNLADIAMKARSADYGINQDMVGKVTGAIDAALAGLFA